MYIKTEKNLFLIMCHKNASQVLRLAKKCVTENSDVVIHADLLMPTDEYKKLEKEVCLSNQIFLTDRRIHGELDKRSLIDIVFLMIETAKKNEKIQGVKYRYYCLMSGQDYLIKPVSFINDQLICTYPKPYIDCTPYNKNNWLYKKFRWNPITGIIKTKIDEIFINQRSPFRVFLMICLLGITKLVSPLYPDNQKALTNQKAFVCGGSAWWILPDIAIEYIQNEYIKNTKIVKLLLKTITPEETFFQIMAMCSPIKDMIQINPIDMTEQNCKTWAYFYDENKPPRNHPYTFTINEFEKLKESDCWIARKFDQETDPEILDMLDSYIEQNTP